MSDDHSPGDARFPYSDQGGPQARHAQTHDVKQEQRTNPKGPEPIDTSFAEQMEPEQTGIGGGHAEDSVLASDDKRIVSKLKELDGNELARLSILKEGTRLEQGGTYLDLTRRGDGPFQALAGHVVGPREQIVAKRETDYDLWNELVGRARETSVERPETRRDQGM